MDRLSSEEIIAQAEGRGEKIAALLPRANWVHIEGNFTPEELRAIAFRVEDAFKED